VVQILIFSWTYSTTVNKEDYDQRHNKLHEFDHSMSLGRQGEKEQPQKHDDRMGNGTRGRGISLSSVARSADSTGELITRRWVDGVVLGTTVARPAVVAPGQRLIANILVKARLKLALHSEYRTGLSVELKYPSHRVTL